MPSQTFISKEFTVDLNKEQTIEKLLAIPGALNNIFLLSNNVAINSLRFLYKQPLEKLNNHLEVFLTSVTDSSTKITINSSYADNTPFDDDRYPPNALNNFIQAINKSIEGKLSDYKTNEVTNSGSSVMMGLIIFGVAIVAIFLGLKACGS